MVAAVVVTSLACSGNGSYYRYWNYLRVYTYIHAVGDVRSRTLDPLPASSGKFATCSLRDSKPFTPLPQLSGVSAVRLMFELRDFGYA